MERLRPKSFNQAAVKLVTILARRQGHQDLALQLRLYKALNTWKQVLSPEGIRLTTTNLFQDSLADVVENLRYNPLSSPDQSYNFMLESNLDTTYMDESILDQSIAVGNCDALLPHGKPDFSSTQDPRYLRLAGVAENAINQHVQRLKL